MTATERRAAIIQAAMKLFSERGFRGTTTREIASAVGVSEPVLYQHFPSKGDLYTAIIETGPSRKYLVKFANDCRELKWAWHARVESRPGICLRPGDVIVAGQQFGIADRCYISSITQIQDNKPQTPASY